MCDSASELVHRHSRTEFKNFNVLGFDHGLEGDEINRPRAWGAMICAGKMHVMNVKAGQIVPQTLQMHRMMNKAEVLFDLSMAGVMPINQVWTGQFAKQKRE